MIIHDNIEIPINNRNITYYKNKGYTCKSGEKLIIFTKDLIPGSPILEERECDCCHKNFVRQHCINVSSYQKFQMDVCPECFKSNAQIKEKIEEKKKETFLKIYGVTNPSYSPEILNKISQTTFEHYGVYNSFQSKQVQEKHHKTMMEKYGTIHPLQVKEFKEKFNQTMCEGQIVKTSSQQKACYNMLIEHKYNAILNAPVSTCSLDVLIIINDDIKIDLEYDGLHWHDKKQQIKDRRRDEFLKQQGYKIFRIVSERGIPTWEQLIN